MKKSAYSKLYDLIKQNLLTMDDIRELAEDGYVSADLLKLLLLDQKLDAENKHRF